MSTSTLPLAHLQPHPAQMRTRYDLEALATLTLQVYERGLDTWQPITASAHEDGYYIISGHRRHMAQLLTFALQDWAAEHPDTPITIDVVRTMVETLVDSLGSLDDLIISLLAKYGQREIPFVPFEGSPKEQVLALQAANYGRAEPDMLGVATSFRQALEAGATEEEIARNCGQHVHFVRNHLALTRVQPALAERVVAGELPLGVAVAVAALPEPKRTGLSLFILANEPDQITAQRVKACASTLKGWPGLQPPLMVKHPAQRNVARALVRLWEQAVDAYPEDAFAAAAMFIYRDVHQEPWANQERLALWFQALGGETYFNKQGVNWTAVLDHLLPEVTCATCPISRLPDRLLQVDLSEGQGGPLGMPCRVGESAERCLHGLAEDDPFVVRVPWPWSGHPGVVRAGGDYRVTSFEDLQRAWQTQAEQEAAAAEVAVQEAVSPNGAGAGKEQVSATVPATAVTPPATHRVASAQQQARLTAFMAQVTGETEGLATEHPWATPCGRCRHYQGEQQQGERQQAERQQVDDQGAEGTVPPCTWATEEQRVFFWRLQPTGGERPSERPSIPVCDQFAPNQPWPELIPPYPQPPALPRAWLRAQILHLAKTIRQTCPGRAFFTFLTGRPLVKDEPYDDWFEQQLAEQEGELSDAQILTLFIWVHAAWQRCQRRPFTLPATRQGLAITAYQEQPWLMTVPEEAT